jgi:hypothetical protein
MINNELTFNITDMPRGGSYFVDFLFDADKPRKHFKNPESFETLLAKLHNLSSTQDIFQQSDEEKTTFELFGTFRGHWFSIYDYKDSRSLHVGGNEDLPVRALISALVLLLESTACKPFIARSPYSNQIICYPCKTNGTNL